MGGCRGNVEGEHSFRSKENVVSTVETQVVIVYESMYGNTHHIAEHIANGLGSGGVQVHVVSVGEALPDLLAAADLLIVGGPTHVHAMTSATSRHAAIATADKDGLQLDPAATNPGLRDWFDQLDIVDGTEAAAFDTRVDGWALFTGRASHGIASHLTERGYRLLDEPESFLVDKHNRLVPDEAERATAWGASLAAAMHRLLDHHW